MNGFYFIIVAIFLVLLPFWHPNGQNIIKRTLKNKVYSFGYKINTNLHKCNKDLTQKNFLLPFILSTFDINVPEGGEVITKYAFGVFIFSLIALLAFINILGYFLSLHLIQRYDIQNKYPKLKYIVNYYEKSSLIFILMETLFCLGCLLYLIITALIILNKIIV